MNFSEVLEEVKRGSRAAREGWNGKGMWIGLVSDWTFENPAQWPVGERSPFLAMRTADDKIVPWLASQTDLLAEDWEVIP